MPTSEPLTFTVEYAEPLLSAAVRRAVFRRLGPGAFVAFGGLIAAVAWMGARGERGATFGALAAVAALCGVLIVALFREHRRRALEAVRRLNSPRATFEIGEETFAVSSDHGSFTMPWSSVADVHRGPGYWLLMYDGAQFTFLPTSGVPAEALERVANRVEAARAARRASASARLAPTRAER